MHKVLKRKNMYFEKRTRFILNSNSRNRRFKTILKCIYIYTYIRKIIDPKQKNMINIADRDNCVLLNSSMEKK